MDKGIANKFLQALACCSCGNLCDKCPWNGTDDCENTPFSEPLIVEVLDAVSGGE